MLSRVLQYARWCLRLGVFSKIYQLITKLNIEKRQRILMTLAVYELFIISLLDGRNRIVLQQIIF